MGTTYDDVEPKETDALLEKPVIKRVDSRLGLVDGKPGPKDKYNVVYIIFALIGMGQLLPWNFYITANDYFNYKLRNTSLNETDWMTQKTYLQVTFENWFSISSMVTNILFVFLSTILLTLFSASLRMLSSLFTMLVIFILTTVLTQVNTDKWQMTFFVITVICVATLSSACAIIQASIFGLSAMLPPRYTTATMKGQAAAGLFAATASIITVGAGGQTPEASALAFFLTATVAVIVAIIAYLSLSHTVFGRFYLYDYYKVEVDESDFANAKKTEDKEVEWQHSASSEIMLSVSGSMEDENKCKTKRKTPPFLKIFWLVKTEAISVWLVFFVTLCLFPPICSNIQSVNTARNSLWSTKLFIPVVCFLLFNFGDLLGRIFTGVVEWPKLGSRLLPFLSALRVIFIPLFLFCNIQPRNDIPVVFNHDAWPIVFMLGFAITNGYLGTISMMHGPQKVENELAETAGAVCAFMLTFGLFCGSLFSFLLVSLVTG